MSKTRQRSRACLLTFDVEDWFQVENLRPLFPPETWPGVPRRVAASTRVILRFLDECGIRATFFVLGWVAEREPALVKEIAARGHEVACHGDGHVLPLRLSLAEFRDDVARARAILQDITGAPVSGYRAPSFSIDRERLMVLADLGFRYDSSHHPFSLNDRYGRLSDLGPALRPDVYRVAPQLLELGLPVERIGGVPLPASGGGFFRLYPGALFRALARRAMARRGHYVLYLHSWEFDPDQPRVRTSSRLGTFRHYNNLKRTLPRLQRLVGRLRGDGATFLPAGEFLADVTA
jgi:polysaccharide deacetylase family protein (PEP-CTERM system associated)